MAELRTPEPHSLIRGRWAEGDVGLTVHMEETHSQGPGTCSTLDQTHVRPEKEVPGP